MAGTYLSAYLYKTTGRIYHYCPGCDSLHCFWVENDGKPVWHFDGNPDKPSVTPSIKVTWTYGEQRTPKCCHYFITAGKIAYLADCTHALAGKTIDIPPIPADYFTA